MTQVMKATAPVRSRIAPLSNSSMIASPVLHVSRHNESVPLGQCFEIGFVEELIAEFEIWWPASRLGVVEIGILHILEERQDRPSAAPVL